MLFGGIVAVRLWAAEAAVKPVEGRVSMRWFCWGVEVNSGYFVRVLRWGKWWKGVGGGVGRTMCRLWVT